MNISIFTTYYNRPIMIKNLCKKLAAGVPHGMHVDHVILDDGSEYGPGDIEKYSNQRYKVHLYEHEENQGQEGYWMTLNNCLAVVRRESDYIMHLADDFIVCNGFFDHVANLMKKLPEHGLLTLTLSSHQVFDDGRTIAMIDGCFVTRKEIFECIDWEIDPVPKKETVVSSGAWRSFTNKLFERNIYAKIYYTSLSLAKHLGHDSVMHQENRYEYPITTRRFANKLSNVTIHDTRENLSGIGMQRESKKVKILTAEGLGNIIQTSAVYLNAVRKYDHVDIQHNPNKVHHPDKLAYYEILTKYYGGKISTELPGEYDITINAVRQPAKYLNEVHMSRDLCNEHGLSMSKRDDPLREMLPLDWKKIRGDDFTNPDCYAPIVICNGSVNTRHWTRKRYALWTEVVQILKSWNIFTVSVGNPDEYIHGTKDGVKFSIQETFDLISRARIFVGTDTGLYHFANAIGKRNVCLMTFTRPDRILWDGFHKYAVGIAPNIGCFPCQPKESGFTNEFKACYGCKGQYMDPHSVAVIIRDTYRKSLDHRYHKDIHYLKVRK